MITFICINLWLTAQVVFGMWLVHKGMAKLKISDLRSGNKSDLFYILVLLAIPVTAGIAAVAIYIAKFAIKHEEPSIVVDEGFTCESNSKDAVSPLFELAQMIRMNSFTISKSRLETMASDILEAERVACLKRSLVIICSILKENSNSMYVRTFAVGDNLNIVNSRTNDEAVYNYTTGAFTGEWETAFGLKPDYIRTLFDHMVLHPTSSNACKEEIFKVINSGIHYENVRKERAGKFTDTKAGSEFVIHPLEDVTMDFHLGMLMLTSPVGKPVYVLVTNGKNYIGDLNEYVPYKDIYDQLKDLYKDTPQQMKLV